MFAAAPPAYVVALLIHLMWIPLRFLEMAGVDCHGGEVVRAWNFVATILVTAAAWELARRGRGRVRAAMIVTCVANFLVFAIQGLVVALAIRHTSSPDIFRALGWVFPIVALVGVVALAVAAGRRAAGASIAMVLLSISIFPVPPLSVLMVQTLSTLMYWLYFAVLPLRNFFVARSVAVVARQCYEPTRDHVRAARGLIAAMWILAAQAVLAAVVTAIGESTTIIQLYLDGAHFVVLAALAYALWVVAQSQLPKLPRYMLFFAQAGVLTSVVIIGTSVTFLVGYGVFENLYEPGAFASLLRWQFLPELVGIALLLVSLLRYSRKPSVVIGAAIFTVATGVGLLQDSAYWVCVAIGSVAVLPALRTVSLALRGDPVKTTADVFA